jgi:hypothetical protein
MIEFLWHVPSSGFEWVVAESWVPTIPPFPASGRFLEPCGTWSMRGYQPLTDEPALFRKFADVMPTETSIQVFATRYGGLGVVEFICLPNGRPSHGEPFHLWVEEIRSLKAVLQLWDALTEKRYEDLAHWMYLERGPWDGPEEWDFIIRYVPDRLPEDDPQVVHMPLVRIPALVPGRWMWSAGDTGRPSGDPTIREVSRNPQELALAYIRELINLRLRDYTSTRLLDREASRDGVPLGLSIVPTNLLGAIWLQCARAIEGVGRYQRCPRCQEWFAVPPKAMRENTNYCSTRCRVAAFRARRKQESQSLV